MILEISEKASYYIEKIKISTLNKKEKITFKLGYLNLFLGVIFTASYWENQAK